MEKKYAADAKGQPLQSLADLFSAPNDMAVLMDKMAAVAPNDIAPDFQSLASALHHEVNSAGAAFSDPLGALAGGLATGLAVSGSEQRVNTYLEQNCAGLPGISSTGSGASGGVTLPPFCAEQGSQPTILNGALGNGVDEKTFLAGLRQLSAAAYRPLSQAAKTLAKQVTSETPAPGGSLEAISRLSWKGVDVKSELQGLSNAYGGACQGSQLFTSDEVSGLGDITPRPAPGGGAVVTDTVYGQSCSNPTITSPFDFVFICGQSVEVLDGATGALAVSSSFLPAQPASSAPNGTQLLGPDIAGSDVVWLSVDVSPASGLSAPTWSATLHIRGLDGQVVADTAVEPSQPEQDGSVPQMAIDYAGSQGVAINLNVDPNSGAAQEQFYTLAGTPVGGAIAMPGGGNTASDENEGSAITMDAISLEGDLYDLADHAVMGTLGGFNLYTDSGCSTNALIDMTDSQGNDSYEHLADSAGHPSLQPLSAGLSQSLYLGSTGFSGNDDVKGVFPNGLLVANGSTPAALLGWDGSQAWSLSQNVASKATGNAGYVVVTNQSGQKVLADAATGGAVTSLPAALSAQLADGGTSVAYVDQTGNIAVLDSGGTYFSYPYNEVCPAS